MRENSASSAPKTAMLLAAVYVTALFFIWAFVTNLVDPLVKSMKVIYTLSDAEAQLNQFAFFLAYGVMSIPAAWYLASSGYSKSIILGLSTIVVGCLIAFSTAFTHSFITILLGLFVAASGIALLQVAANPLIAAMGDEKGAHFRLNLSQAFNSMGAFAGGMFGSKFLLQGPLFEKGINITEEMKHIGLSFVTKVYFEIAIVLAFFTFIVFLVRNIIDERAPKNITQTDDNKSTKSASFIIYGGTLFIACVTILLSIIIAPFLQDMTSMIKTMVNIVVMLAFFAICSKLMLGMVQKKYPQFIQNITSPLKAMSDKWATLGSLGIFLYVGAEICVLSGMIFFLEQEQILNLPSQVAGFVGPVFMLFAMFGRFIGSWLMTFIKASKMLAIVAGAASILCIIVIVTYNQSAIPLGGEIAIPTFPGVYKAPITTGFIPGFAAILIGLFNSIMFPTIFTMTLERSNIAASAVSGLMCMYICGGGFISVAYGYAVDYFLVHFPVGARSLAFIVPLFCYIYVLWFAIAASKAKIHKIEENIVSAH